MDLMIEHRSITDNPKFPPAFKVCLEELRRPRPRLRLVIKSLTEEQIMAQKSRQYADSWRD